MSALADTIWEIPPRMRAASQSTFYLLSNAIDDASPWTGERNPYGPFAQVFIAEITPPPAKSPKNARDGEVTWRDWQGFVTRLAGTSGLLRVVDYFRMRPLYDLRAAPTTSLWSGGEPWSGGAAWTSGALPPFLTFAEAVNEDDETAVLRGLPANTDLALNPSDLFEARPGGRQTPWGNLYEIVHCARSNADGKARVYFQPGARQAFAAGDLAVIRYPTCVFRLADSGQGIITRTAPAGFGNLGFKVIEQTRNV